ncbi:hypothetical protein SOM70_20185 [Streptomyces salinarius]|uniref:acyl-CoA-like ligand-binding transcription factor n=1 Tax=Streptomyces TaxID=1883 RepID=UPI001E51D772|nr:hypothetical protein [Streptomyces sp. HB-N217]
MGAHLSGPPNRRFRGIGLGVLFGGLTTVVSLAAIERAWAACDTGVNAAANGTTLLFLAPLIWIAAYADTAGDREVVAGDVGVWEALRAGFAAVLSLHDDREQALQRFRLLHNTASLRAGWLEKRLRFQEELLPLVEARMDVTAGTAGARARAVLATAFACLDAASMTWVAGDGQSTIMDLYDECLTAVRG